MNSALSYLFFIRARGFATRVETSVLNAEAQDRAPSFSVFKNLQPIVDNLCYVGTTGFRGQLFRIYMNSSAYLKRKFEVKNIDSSFFKTMLIKHTIMGLNDNELNKLVGVVSVFWTQWKWFKIDLILDHTAQIRSDQSLSCVRLFVTP